MKRIIYLIVMIFFFSACKKDMITVAQNKIYEEVGKTSSNPQDGGMYVELKSSGDAGFALGGDAIHTATYKISGATLKVYWNGETYRIKIVSEDELDYNGKILKLRK